MIGLVLVTHGRLAVEFRAALEHVVGIQTQLETITIAADDDMETCRSAIKAAVHNVNSGDGVIVLTDMFGGTPSNLALSTLKSGHIEVIAGMNLPMLIKIASLRSIANFPEVVLSAQEAGRKYITIASHVLASI